MAASLRRTLYNNSCCHPSYFVQQGSQCITYTRCLRSVLNRCFILRNQSNGTYMSNLITKDSKVDKSVAEHLEQQSVGKSGHINYRSHPGVINRKKSNLPSRLVKAIKILIEKYPVKALAVQTEKLLRYLQHRRIPPSDSVLTDKAREIESKILEKDGNIFEGLSGSSLKEAIEAHKRKIFLRLKKTVYHWKPMQYDAFTSYVYLVSSITLDFAAASQCFTEITKRDPDFKPLSVYHLGSKVGAGIWAADKAWRTIGEHYCIDSSPHMNTIAQLLLQDGNEQLHVQSIPGVYFRQFEPSAKEHKHPLVVSTNILIEQPSQQERLKLVQDLWERTQNYLILIEYGTTAGFTLINEARDYLIWLSADQPEDFEGHAFAPCPHDRPCPKNARQQLCLAQCTLHDQPLTPIKLTENPKKTARYSYLIFKRGPREKATTWPRVIQESKASKHTHLHLCLPCGDLQHVVVTRGKFEKHLYSCSRNVDQGDLLPVSLSNEPLKPSDKNENIEEISNDEIDEANSNDTSKVIT
ncbi:methyltransferase-like protein 17, mitochondrial [Physella acuta]|uniref:methyltransferase-like protein 17, mitochondrial n=1 Tax=Physella acuta TaxID=109671 RepID=UPI0027DAC7FE|nr:methyltransferase-like protein 17, mitochondrial [Physella acuta]